MSGEQTPGPDDRGTLVAEARRLYERYAVEVIEAFGFCPWAAEARRSGQVHVEIVTGEVDVLTTLSHMDALAARPELAIGLLVFPEGGWERVPFQHFAAAVRERDRTRQRDGSPAWAVADFHPDAEPDTASADRLVAYIRRSPDPTLQLVRHSILEHVRRGDGGGTRFVDPTRLDLAQLTSGEPANTLPIHARVGARNLATVLDRGVEVVEDRIRDILRDRRETYRRLGLPACAWEREL